jgi:hypothetical protein
VEEQSARNWSLLLGPGPRLRGLKPLLVALGSSGMETGGGIGALSVAALSDLAQLLAVGGSAGRLILDADQIPAEDIGFVRRFLADRQGWSLLLLGMDAGRQEARSLLALPRAGWLAWPPDLDQLRGLIQAPAPPRAAVPLPASRPGAGGPARGPELGGLAGDLLDIAQGLTGAFEALRTSARLSEPQVEGLAGEVERLARFSAAVAVLASPPARGHERFDLDALLEEELAVLALQPKKTARFKYRGGAALHVVGDREALTRAFGSCLHFARSLAEEGEVVRVVTAPSNGMVTVRIEFPATGLGDVEPGALLIPGSSAAPGAPSHDLAAARAVVRSQGGELEVAAPAEGELEILVTLPAAEPVPAATG